MRALLALSLCLCALPVAGQGLRGQWDVTSTHPEYRAVLLVDADRRATLDSPSELSGRPARFRGYVIQDQAGIKMLFTEGTVVMRMYCAAETADRLQCYGVNQSGTTSLPVFLTRVGPGPQSLRPQHP